MAEQKDIPVKVPGAPEQANIDLYRGSQVGLYLDPGSFNQLQRAANILSESGLVPEQFRGNPAACFIGLDLANRMGVHPFMLIQNMYIVHGRPGLSGQLIIALINQSGRFLEPLDWRFDGAGEAQSCTCVAKKKSGEEITVTLTWAAVVKEGWNKDKQAKGGGTILSKWNTMRDLMFRYRTATQLGRLYCPDLLMGMREMGEILDLPASEFEVVSTTPVDQASSVTSKVEGKLAEKRARKAQDAQKADQGAQTPAEDVNVPQAGAGEAEQAPAPADTTGSVKSWQAKVADLPLKEAAAWALQEWLKAGFTQEDAESTVGCGYAQWTRVKIMALMDSAFKTQDEMVKAGV